MPEPWVVTEISHSALLREFRVSGSEQQQIINCGLGGTFGREDLAKFRE